MPLFITIMGAMLAASVVGMVARVLAAIGMGVVSYVGVSYVLQQAISMLHSQIGGLPSDISNLLGMAGFDVFLSLVVSARFGVISFLLAHSGLKRITFTESP